MKKQRNYSQIKKKKKKREREKSPKRANNETDLSSLLDLQFKKEVIKMLEELKIINRNVDHCTKELETIKRNQSKLDNSIAEIKSELKVMNSRLNNALWISDLKESWKSTNQNSRQKDKWKNLKATYEVYGIILSMSIYTY